MPTYTYRCDHCGHAHAELHPAGERLSLGCPDCGTTPLEWQFPVPCLDTDTTFMANRDDGFGSNELGRRQAYAKARREGASTSGTYSPQLQAWIDGKADVKRICEKKGWGCSGGVTVAVPPSECNPGDKPYQAADNLVCDEVDKIVRTQHGGRVTAQQRQDLTESASKRLSGRK